MNTEQKIKRASKPCLAVLSGGPLDATIFRAENSDRTRLFPCDKVYQGKKLLAGYRLCCISSERVLHYKFAGFAESKQAEKAKAFVTRV